jgi:uncharacterized damage-inducible protein DinB
LPDFIKSCYPKEAKPFWLYLQSPFKSNFIDMALQQALAAELKHDATLTRKTFERLPQEFFGWKPHEKSYSVGELASHIANLTSWVGLILNSDEFDFLSGTGGPKRTIYKNAEELLAAFDSNVEQALAELSKVSEEDLNKTWKLCRGEHVIVDRPRKIVMRSMVFNHIVHHRGQLTVYLRLLNIPLPELFGPTADTKR